MRYRIKHIKVRELVYLSHLDLLLTMQRALRRTKLPFALTQGFNPRPKFAYGQPVAVGTASIGEYFDLYLTEELPLKEVLEAFNKALPRQLYVLGGQKIDTKRPALMAEIEASQHLLWIKGQEDNREWLEEFAHSWSQLESMELINWKGILQDLKPLIMKIEWWGWQEQWACLALTSKAGSRANLNMHDFCTYLQQGDKEPIHENFRILRKEIFFVERGMFKTPLGLEVNLL